ncbi:MAG: PD-(D/E)XK nuclease family protein [Fulvivirga sp.]|nr:PD-(D/E)XK nuclease family protein [Fulvivirga sp.]
MQTFLQEIAKKLLETHQNQLGETTVIFPNRRAGLYFREYLKEQLIGPVWSPTIMSFQDFAALQSPLQKADQLMLVHRLYEVYNKGLKNKESFDKFFFWGQMLLKDFEDIDKYLVDAENLYTNLNRQKQLDLTFDFLDEEQKKLIQKFWQGFDQTSSKEKKRFQFIWERLYQVYARFNQSLKQEGLAYEGMQYRYLAENIADITLKKTGGPIMLAGFNALNAAEEKIIKWLLEHRNTSMHWDIDAYYMQDSSQEAGHFLRDYKKSNDFGKTFGNEYPSLITGTHKSVKQVGVPQHVGQAKVLGQKLEQLLKAKPDIDLTKIAIVLADESLLFPVLHALPEQITAINVTMGFPLAYAPVNSLIEHVLELQHLYNQKQQVFNHKPALAILRHPLIVAQNPGEISKLAVRIEKENKVFLKQEDITDIPILNLIFTESAHDLVAYLADILLELHDTSNEKTTVETEYIHHFYQLLNRYKALLESSEQKVDVLAFSRLFKQLIRTERLPFTGEPLRGIQIMGVLETRNLDFDYVYALSMNEDFFPSKGGKHSFIPYNLRKAYGLPNYDQQDAIYAYLFYRLLQRPKHVELFYNTEGNDLGGEEKSRFLQQLVHESGLNIEEEILANKADLEEIQPITINKDEACMKRLARFIEEGSADKGLSPSAINTYLDCRLKFYFRYVMNLYEKDAIEEDVDARSLGNVLHKAMEYLYEDYVKEKENSIIKKKDIKVLKSYVEKAILKAFKHQFSIPDDRSFFYEGKNIIAREIIKDFMQAILKLDQQYVPFEFVSAEDDNFEKLKIDAQGKEMTVRLRGQIDRVDRKHGVVRLIDYKTGKDTHKFDEIEDLFNREKKDRNKAAFQTLFYALLYRSKKEQGERMMPAVFNKEALFQGKEVTIEHKQNGPVMDAEPYLTTFKSHLKEVLAELFDTEITFDQTTDENKCKYCVYNNICCR